MAGYRTLPTELTSQWEFLNLDELTASGFQVPDLQCRVLCVQAHPRVAQACQRFRTLVSRRRFYRRDSENTLCRRPESVFARGR